MACMHAAQTQPPGVPQGSCSQQPRQLPPCGPLRVIQQTKQAQNVTLHRTLAAVPPSRQAPSRHLAHHSQGGLPLDSGKTPKGIRVARPGCACFLRPARSATGMHARCCIPAPAASAAAAAVMRNLPQPPSSLTRGPACQVRQLPKAPGMLHMLQQPGQGQEWGHRPRAPARKHSPPQQHA